MPSVLARGDGVIVNMVSVVRLVTGVPDRFACGASKAAVIGMSKPIAANFAGKGFRCNAICRGTVALHARLAATGDNDAAWEAFTAHQPRGRVGEVDGDRRAGALPGVERIGPHHRQAHVIHGGWTS